MKRKPVDLPSIVKRLFLRGLRGGSERESVNIPSFGGKKPRPHSVSNLKKTMSDSSAEEAVLSLFLSGKIKNWPPKLRHKLT